MLSSKPAKGTSGKQKKSLDPRIERTRKAAISTAQEIIVNEGWDALTHMRVATESGISRMTIYRHWPTTVDLLRDVLRAMSTVENIQLTGNLRQDLLAEIALLRAHLFDASRVRLLATLLERAQTDETIADVRDEMVEENTKNLQKILQSPEARRRLSHHGSAAELVGVIMGPFLYQRMVLGRAITDDFTEATIDAFLKP